MYNGDVHVCPNGEYQQKIMFEILEEVLTTHPFDGVFCNMSGFLVMDYSGNFHGPWHCDSCKKKYLEIYGTEMPEADDIRNPAFVGKYMQFTGRCTAEHKTRMKALAKGISEEIAMNGVDYIRSESNTEIDRNEWIYSASGNSRLSAGPFHKRPADNASVDFMGFRYRHACVSPALMELRQWQNLANAGSASIYIMGHLNNHPDVSSFALTKKAFRFHAEHEDIFTNMVSGAEVMVLRSTNWHRADDEVYGWIRALTESHIPFDEMSINELQDAAQLTGKKCLILPGIRNLNPKQAGVDPELVFQASKGGLAGSTVMNAKAPMMIAGNDKPGFKIDLHIKDLNNALDCAHTVGAPVPMTAQVQEIMQWMHNHEGGQKDHSAIAQYYEFLTGEKIGQ